MLDLYLKYLKMRPTLKKTWPLLLEEGLTKGIRAFTQTEIELFGKYHQINP